MIRKKYRILTNHKYERLIPKKSIHIELDNSIPSETSFVKNSFTFLNLSKEFRDKIDWSFLEYGKLWNYNLNYFDFLNQQNIGLKDALWLINDFIDQLDNNKYGMDSYPTSLRTVNWTKFLNKNRIKDKNITSSLYTQIYILSDNLEYNLLGNHLLENAFSLLYGSYYFDDYNLYNKAKRILVSELKEQILDDGGHYELSPMYHQIILFRFLDCLNLVKNNNKYDNEILGLLVEKVEKMLLWINAITFNNGNIPLFNDSAYGIAPTTRQLFDYAEKLGVRMNGSYKCNMLHVSGYKKIVKSNYEIIIDVGKIGPDYITAHSHSDTFNFELYIDDKPFIVDTGTSTYEPGALRLYERSTSAHNTVKIENYDQSEIWSSFRVGRRAYVKDVKMSENEITAAHDGYKRMGAIHRRSMRFSKKNVEIIDEIDSQKMYYCYSYLHFYPGIQLKKDGNVVYGNNKKIIIHNATSINIEKYHYAPEFNKLLEGQMLKIVFNKSLRVKIIGQV
ncbi:MAG: heparinase II/III family protein [Candidatus Scalindua sp.]